MPIMPKNRAFDKVIQIKMSGYSDKIHTKTLRIIQITT